MSCVNGPYGCPQYLATRLRWLIRAWLFLASFSTVRTDAYVWDVLFPHVDLNERNSWHKEVVENGTHFQKSFYACLPNVFLRLARECAWIALLSDKNFNQLTSWQLIIEFKAILHLKERERERGKNRMFSVCCEVLSIKWSPGIEYEMNSKLGPTRIFRGCSLVFAWGRL